MKVSLILIALGAFVALAQASPAKLDWTKYPIRNLDILTHRASKQIHKPATPLNYKRGTESFSDVCGKSAVNTSSYIVGGKEAEPHSWPWSSALFGVGSDGSNEFGYFCTSSLISDKYILTAAHCIDIATRATFYLGSHDLRDDESSRVVVNAKRFIVHPDWNPNTLENDIGLVELEESVEFSDELRPNCLPAYSDQDNDLTGTTVTLIGWGLTGTDQNEISPVLNQVQEPVISNKECNELYGIITDGHMCTDSTGPKSICFGDSGGSVNWEKTKGNYAQVGVNSFIAYNCESEYPNGLTRVTHYLQFIESESNVKIDE